MHPPLNYCHYVYFKRFGEGKIAKETDIYIEVNNVLTKIECDQKIATGNMFGFAPINHFTRNYRQGERFTYNTDSFHKYLLNYVYKYLPLTMICNGIEYELAHLNRDVKMLKYKTGDHFKGVHCDDTYTETVNGVLYKSLLTLMIYLNEDYAGGRTTLCTFNKHNELEIKPRTGKLVAISQTIAHYAKVVTKGEKYLLRADVLYKRKKS